MANQTSKRLLALVLAICLSLGLLLPAGQANATGSAGILTEVTGQEREQLSSLVDGTLAMEEQQEELPAADTPVRVFIVLSGKKRPGAGLCRLCHGGGDRLHRPSLEPAGGGDSAH